MLLTYNYVLYVIKENRKVRSTELWKHSPAWASPHIVRICSECIKPTVSDSPLHFRYQFLTIISLSLTGAHRNSIYLAEHDVRKTEHTLTTAY